MDSVVYGEASVSGELVSIIARELILWPNHMKSPGVELGRGGLPSMP
jgi:hypothetical protein